MHFIILLISYQKNVNKSKNKVVNFFITFYEHSINSNNFTIFILKIKLYKQF